MQQDFLSLVLELSPKWKPVRGKLADNPPANAPAGGVHCTLRDRGKFLALVLAGARGEHIALVTDATMKRLLTP